MQFRARVIDQHQRLSSIDLEAVDIVQARQRLSERGLKPVSLAASRAWLSWGPQTRRQKFPLTLFAQELLALLQAGLAIAEAIDALLAQQAAGSYRACLERLASDLRVGRRFSDALQSQPGAFPTLFVGMIGVAERTSNVADALLRYLEYRKQVDALRATVTSAAVYPLILLMVGGTVSLFLMGYVVPKFAQVYEGTGRDIPWASQLLLDWGRFVSAHGTELALAVVAALSGMAVWLREASRSGALAAWLAKLPWVGARLQVMARARLYLTLGMLLEGGMSINQALLLLESAGPAEQAGPLERLRHAIFRGEALSAALQSENLATPIGLRLIQVGERSGQLGQMLRRAAQFHEGETARWLERFSRAFEPLLMAAIGAVIGLIVLLLYMPIFDLAGSFQ